MMTPAAKIIRAAMDAAPMGPSLDEAAEALAAALDDAGYAIRKKPAPRVSKPVEVFAPNTGDAALDEFMRAHHHHDWEARLRKATARNRPGMLTMPAPAPGIQHKPMTQQERADLYRDHKVIQHSN